MSVERLERTLVDLRDFLGKLEEEELYAERDRLAFDVARAIDPILRTAKGQRGSMTFPQQSQPTPQQQPGASVGSSQNSLAPQPAVTQTNGTIECPRCKHILNIDVTLS